MKIFIIAILLMSLIGISGGITPKTDLLTQNIEGEIITIMPQFGQGVDGNKYIPLPVMYINGSAIIGETAREEAILDYDAV